MIPLWLFHILHEKILYDVFHITEFKKAMAQHVYPLYYIRILKELEKGECTKRELKQKLSLTDGKLYRAIYRLLLDGLITRETKENKQEIFKITEKGREYLNQLKEIVMS